jgi:hypothetical protein
MKGTCTLIETKTNIAKVPRDLERLDRRLGLRVCHPRGEFLLMITLPSSGSVPSMYVPPHRPFKLCDDSYDALQEGSDLGGGIDTDERLV